MVGFRRAQRQFRSAADARLAKMGSSLRYRLKSSAIAWAVG